MRDKITKNTVFALFDDEVEALYQSVEGTPMHALFKAHEFKAKSAQVVVMPDEATGLLKAWFGLGGRNAYSPDVFRAASTVLPKGGWALKTSDDLDRRAIALHWGLGAYGFDRYKAQGAKNTKYEVVLDDDLSETVKKSLEIEIAAHNLARDLINTPAQDMGPQDIQAQSRKIAEAYDAKIEVIIGDDLLAQNYPAIHAVGRAASCGREPRFIEMSWSPKGVSKTLPTIILVGKGVSFDTGGLNLKGGSGMGLMKKDMGGAAHVLALAQWIMAEKLAVKLIVLIAAVENSVSGDSFRPGDIVASRAGISIEIGNTDAEGRLILADALTRAGELSPDITLDFATLTGAARVALGPQVIPLYCQDDEFCDKLTKAGKSEHDPIWRMPLWSGYEAALDSDIADIRNDPQSWAQAGSVTAALFLQRFAPKTGLWAHFDIYAWNPRARAGLALGGEAQTLRAVMKVLKSI